MSHTQDLSTYAICVDLDGTLIKTDSLHESLLALFKKNPFNLVKCIFWLFTGKAGFKARVAKHVTVNSMSLPYNQELIKFLNDEYTDNRKYLCTAENERIDQDVADNVGMIQQVYASKDRYRLKGDNKAKLLTEKFGKKQFIYAGNDYSDLKIWDKSAGAIVVSDSQKLIGKVKLVTDIIAHFKSGTNSMKKYLAAIRLHQWVKNLLMVIPMILAHKVMEIDGYINIAIAFVSFGLVASGTYVVNDLMDLDADRAHKTKRNRPFASGALSVLTGIVMAPLLILSGIGIAYLVSTDFLVFVLIYLVVTLIYTYVVKTIAILDVIILAMLYTIRLMAGAVAIEVEITFWLLAYSMFIFFSLANVKRYTEIARLDDTHEISGRGYNRDDANFIRVLGVASGLLSVLVFALYINDPGISMKYTHPAWLWAITPLLLYWVTRIWHLAHHGKMIEDPVVFAIRDVVSYLIAGLVGFGIFMAI